MGLQVPLPCAEKPATGTYHVPVESNPRSHT